VLVVCEEVDVCERGRAQTPRKRLFTQTCIITRPPPPFMTAGVMFLVGSNSGEPLRLVRWLDRFDLT
jgi:hypothetical protein